MNETQVKNRRQLIGMLIISLTTLGGAYALYYAAKQGGIWGTTNNGTFVSPPLVLNELEIRQSDGSPLTEAESWWLWVVASDGCAEACADVLFQLRQLHVLLNKDADRVRRALITVDSARDGRVATVLNEYPRLVHLLGADGQLMDGIYIVDPIGNLVLYYPYDDAGKPVLEDLKKLLKLSQIG